MNENAIPACGQTLHDILLGYLQSNHSFPWPGADGLRLEDALNSYLEAVALGRVPDGPELLSRHPELSDEWRFFLARESNASHRLSDQPDRTQPKN
jgi:hypothetical protein